MPTASLKALIAVLLIAFGVSGDQAAMRARLDLPRLMLWSWDRADDLRFIDPADTGVAYLAATMHLADDQVVVVPRRNPILMPSQAQRVAVFHIELDRDHPPKLDTMQRAALIDAIAGQAPPSGAAVQIDFEVAQSQQAFLTATATDLRQRLPSTPMSLTALSSWCLTERWIGKLPVDEIVPMLFRLGPDRHRTLAHFTAGGDFATQPCRASLGIATDELADIAPLAARLKGRRVYVFSPKPWTATTYTAVRREFFPWSAMVAWF